ncbi:glycoside hydrolase TIM-barrel-like domain-containing protein [Pseudorhodobacter sp.]|uniref:baseplate multidomain protein megatron n=1 Tax=Pseudorhodobacter sp. TaxID=1934400 RepID=UPI0026485316|nr:glycoside hydrolase TIM-barrel-like domain-containing protein [Pseudorhodobacter sp.]MDN5786013.1 glycoside hydrolase TIM-barrel-like domain-containing protein [Pseudorhodobacter sp.]
MATILLSAVGAAAGAGFGGTVLGLSGAVIGRAVGATLGRVIDQRLLGAGSDAVETGRIERFRLAGASEGAAVPQVYGRVRTAGQIIWATQFAETSSAQGGGKGAPKPRVTSFSYTVSFAVALCEGEISGVGRVWADGVEIDAGSVNLRVYHGSEDQLPDPKIAAVEGAGMAPSYRGIAYVVVEDLDLSRFGNRVPQLNFEVIRPAQGAYAETTVDLAHAVRAVAMMPGTGEYALATTALHYDDGPGLNRSANVHSPSGQSDFSTALKQLRAELPQVNSISLVVSWFGDDLRCGECAVQPKVEQTLQDAVGMPWRAGGIARAQAALIAQDAGRPIYGGTPSDASVIEAIQAVRGAGQEVMFYPFILMDQQAGNARPDPYSNASDQPKLPWRGRITLSVAPGRDASPDRSVDAASEVAAFFGTAQVSDFSVSGGTIGYAGPAEWRYRRFVLHYAHLCALAGGVDAFCIGSEMRGLTQIRGPGDSFPAVAALRQLAADVRAILGPDTKLTYAADWSEYFGHHTDGNVYFHLDPLWADANIDFIGIDNYMPLSDWREGDDQSDDGFSTIYDLDYLSSQVLGGEGYDWYYDSVEGEAAQRRLPIEDGAHGEPWIYRYKDLKSWWLHTHHERINGFRQEEPTGWVPQSKPIRFTEYGCAAIDKGSNQPNKFLDPKSSESSLPKFSNGRRDDTIQMQYLRAMALTWANPENNPISTLYAAPMLDMSRAHVWAWDARPFPQFPNDSNLWADGENYARGHWLSGRSTNQPLSLVVAEICERSGVVAFDVSGLFGVVRGYSPEGIGTARAALQPLMLAHGFEAVERDGILTFKMRGNDKPILIAPERLVVSDALDGPIETLRTPEAETAGRVRLNFLEAEAEFGLRQVEAIFPEEESFGVSQTELPLILTNAEARNTVERWLSEARVARDTARFALPRSLAKLGAGDVVDLQGIHYRIDRVEQADANRVEAVRIERSVYHAADSTEETRHSVQFVPPVPVYPVFLDLPLITGDEVPHAPHIAVTAKPWPHPVAVWSAVDDAGYQVNRLIERASIVGVTQTPLAAAQSGLWDCGAPLRIKLSGGSLSAASKRAVLDGANALAIGDGSSDNWEVLQFSDLVLVAPQTYEISTRLRGQLGTDAIMPPIWPAGSLVVILDKSLTQIDLAASARGLARNYRIGAAARGVDDPSVIHRVEAFSGIGLRPYAPVHLRAKAMPDGSRKFSWIRRTRLDGDSWESFEVPLAEESERYLLRIVASGAILREVVIAMSNWDYSAAMQAADAVGGGFEVQVAQISDRFGPGPFTNLTVVS